MKKTKNILSFEEKVLLARLQDKSVYNISFITDFWWSDIENTFKHFNNPGRKSFPADFIKDFNDLAEKRGMGYKLSEHITSAHPYLNELDNTEFCFNTEFCVKQILCSKLMPCIRFNFLTFTVKKNEVYHVIRALYYFYKHLCKENNTHPEYYANHRAKDETMINFLIKRISSFYNINFSDNRLFYDHPDSGYYSPIHYKENFFVTKLETAEGFRII